MLSSKVKIIPCCKNIIIQLLTRVYILCNRCRMSPRSRERLRVALKGFSPDELEPRTSDGELVADLLASAGAEFQRKKSSGRKLPGSSSSSPASSAGSPSPLQVEEPTYQECHFAGMCVLKRLLM